MSRSAASSRTSSARRRTSAPRRCTPSSSTAPASRIRSTCWARCSSSRGWARRRPPSGARQIRDQLGLKSEQVSFLLYHGENDEAHMQEFEDTLIVRHPGDTRHGPGDPEDREGGGAALSAPARGTGKHLMDYRLENHDFDDPDPWVALGLDRSTFFDASRQGSAAARQRHRSRASSCCRSCARWRGCRSCWCSSSGSWSPTASPHRGRCTG